MKRRNTRIVIPLLAASIAGWLAADHMSARADDKHAKTVKSITDLRKMKGPKPPSGATSLGVEAHPAVGEIALPIDHAQVYQFGVKTREGATVPVKWAYQAGKGTYLWATAPLECEDGTTIARAGFVMRIKDDGTGAYALGTRQCPTSGVYGCSFDKQGTETGCGACAWNASDLVCTSDQD